MAHMQTENPGMLTTRKNEREPASGHDTKNEQKIVVNQVLQDGQ
jgi:hypothetical protein